MFVVILAFFKVFYAKNIGTVDVSRYDCKNISSSFVNRICYDPKKLHILVLLKDTYYHYCDFPKSVLAQWLRSDSKGRYYVQNIKGRYNCSAGEQLE